MHTVKYILISLLLIAPGGTLSARIAPESIPDNLEKRTVTYAIKGEDTLRMDLYRLKEESLKPRPVMLFVFGGSFMTGSRDRDYYGDYFRTLAESGFTVASIDYRLGLKGQKFRIRTITSKRDGLSHAIQLAVEDLFSATDYLLSHAERWNIDPDSILASGSSAGAITVLQGDWILKNRMSGSELLPAGFSYRGIIGFAGGIYSRVGGPDYEYGDPAPTLMFHGTRDRVVPYRTIRLFRLGMFTSRNLERRFRRNGWDYAFVDLQGKDHHYGAVTAMSSGLSFTEWFIGEYIRGENRRQVTFRVSEEF